jgi:L-arabinose isomerase
LYRTIDLPYEKPRLINKITMHTSLLKIGLFGIGLDTYWPQFEGLKQRLENYLNTVEQKLAAIHPFVINAGLVDSADKAFGVGHISSKIHKLGKLLNMDVVQVC